MRRFIGVVLASVLTTLFIECAELAKADEKGLISIAEVRTMYDNGLQLVQKKIRKNRSKTKIPLDVVDELIQFRHKNIAWAESRDGKIYALETGVKSGGWLSVDLSTYSEKELDNIYMLTIDSNPELNVLHILPRKVDEAWAGIFLVHELSHLYTRITKIESPNPTKYEWLVDEVKAYDYEILAAEAVSDLQFRHAVIDVLIALNARYTGKFAMRLQKPDDEVIELIRKHLFPVISLNSPQSRHDEWNRYGFACVAMAFEAVRQAHLPNEEELNSLMRVINVLVLQGQWDDDIEN